MTPSEQFLFLVVAVLFAAVSFLLVLCIAQREEIADARADRDRHKAAADAALGLKETVAGILSPYYPDDTLHGD